MKNPKAITKTLIISDDMKSKVIKYVRSKGSISNKECRKLLHIGYDQAITFFNYMVQNNKLTRVGKTSSTKYILPE